VSECQACPLRGRETACLGATEPTFAYFCARAAEGDPAWLRMIADRSEAGYTPTPVATPVGPPIPDIPLAGDVVAAVAKAVGADRLARLWEEWTGIPCGCPERQEKLNRASAKLIKWARRLAR
jgi:hypothetical protein